MIRFSIVVPYCNEAKKLPALIKSIGELEFDKNGVEYIFVSNNSTDESDALVRAAGFHVEYANRLRSSYHARNVGLSAASGDYVLFVDADCVLDKNILKAYMAHISRSDNTAPTIYAGDIRPAVSKGSLVETYSATRRVLNQKSAATGWAYKPFAQTANAMFVRRDLIRIRGFDERMTSGGDAEVCWRLTEKYGHQVLYCEDAIVYHQHRQTVDDFIEQFMKYGRGRFQQASVSEVFARDKKPDDFADFKRRSGVLVDELAASGCPEDVLYKAMDLLRDVYFNIGFLDEMMKTLNRQVNGRNYEFVTELRRQLPSVPESKLAVSGVNPGSSS